MQSQIVDLASVVFDTDGPSRELPRQHRDAPPEAVAKYDRKTLIYHTYWADDALYCICPKLRNFAKLLGDMTFAADGQTLPRPHLKSYRRHDILRFDCPTRPIELTIRGAGHNWTLPLHAPDQWRGFEDRNTLMTLSQNNDLRWISDWARYHVSAQGAQALLLFDNASTAYTPKQIVTSLEQTGLEHVTVVRTPHPYGPRFRTKPCHIAKYLQAGILNIAPRDMLARARAILQIDVDELVWTTGANIFDRAVAHPLGYRRIPGVWRMVHPDTQNPTHIDHTYIQTNAKQVPSKYCAVPSGWLRRHEWDVHVINGLPRLSIHQRPNPEVGFYHCRAIGTMWKGTGRIQNLDLGPRDEAAHATLTRHLTS